MTECFTPVRGSAVRVTALDSRGAVPDPLQYAVSKSIIKVLVNEVVESARNEVLSNPEEQRRLRFHRSAQTIRHTVDIEFLRVDPGFLSLVAGVELVYREGAEGFGEEPFGMAPVGGTLGDIIGFDSGTRLAPKSFALEVWSKLAGGACTVSSSPGEGTEFGFGEGGFDEGPFGEAYSGDTTDTLTERQWGYTLFPHLRGGILGGFKFDGGLVSFTLRGAQTRRASQWGVGPHDIEGPHERLTSPVSRNLSWRMFVTTGAPPTEQCGIQETTDVLDNGTAAEPMPDPYAALAVDAGGAETAAHIIDGGRA